ncbi:Transposon Tf2-6 polyprotein [Caligus rogercresseyi]|uniref:Transposon Tf2-6 polyprotein n=1 Tax=Caligus rogercresseyi TaxID=217165 RepID=A0A7T8GWI2_CALRO|nr:Transposon Tf2-6 polyprotein [Caligus rogercresseyi]
MPNTRSEGAMKEEDQTPTDPVQLMMAMMKEMKEEAKKREDQLMRQLQEQAQDFAAALQTNRGNAGGSTKSKKMDVPVLKCPEDINLADFRDWQQRFADYTEVQKIMEECTLSGRQSLLRSGLDPAWTKLWSTGILEIDDRKDDINDIIKKILHYIREHRNPLLDRKEFLERNQHAGESIDVYYSALKSIDESCGYDVNPTCKVCDDACGHGDELQQERLRDRLICGLKDQAIQQKVLAIPFKDLTLKKALEVCRVEAASKETQASLNKSERQVNRLKERSSYKKGKIDNNPLSKSAQKADERCSNCGRKKHQKPDQCWARDKDCNNCGLKEVNRMTIGQVKTSDDLVKITAKIGNADHQEVEWLPDTGAECDVITADCLKKVGTKVKDLRKDKAELCGPDQGRLKSLGKVTATLEREGMKYKTELHVLEKGTGPILSKVGCTALGLIPTGWPHVVNKLSLSSPDEGNGVDMLLKSQSAASIREQLFQEFPEVFPPDDEVLPLKPMKGPPMKIELLPGTSPIRRYRCNTIPLHWQDKVKAHLETMVQKQIIERVPQGEAPEWLFSMVVVPKAGTDEPRVTVDFSPLNPFVKRPMYPCRVPAEEVAQIPPGMTHFTVLDGRHGYWQVLLDKPSSKIMTFNTPWGMFRYLRNAMGLISAGDEFNRRGDDAIAGIPNVKKIVEDIIIYDKDEDTHLQRVKEVIQRCDEHGITLGRRKSTIAEPSVTWCGYRISKDGYTANPGLVDALTKFPVPKNRTDVRSFCGLVQQFEALSADLTGLLEPIRALLPARSAFVWEGLQQQAFEKTIAELTSPRVLTQFRPGANLRLETDASQRFGLGFALYQEEGKVWKILRVGSRTLAPAETRYSVTEIELQGVVWATKKLKFYLRGKAFEVIVDHKPLVSIVNHKALDEIETPRIQRMKEKMNMYLATAVWRPGVKHTVADAFSRYPVSEPTEDDLEGDEEMEKSVKLTLNAVSLQDPKLEEVRLKTETDPVLLKLKEVIVDGFPEHKANLDTETTGGSVTSFPSLTASSCTAPTGLSSRHRCEDKS